MQSLGLLVNFGLFVFIWTVQIIIYPSFFEVDEKRFAAWHDRYMTQVSFLAAPLMITQVLILGWLLIQSIPDPSLLAQSILVLFVWIVTVFVSIPCHRVLAVKKDGPQIARLVSSNWLRTAAWSLVALLDWLPEFRL